MGRVESILTIESGTPFTVQDLFGRTTHITPLDSVALISVDDSPVVLTFGGRVEDFSIEPVAGGAEVTIECNPESSWPESLTPWVEGGVNRLSLGLQSMDPQVLEFLGRLNTPDSNRRALELACSLVD